MTSSASEANPLDGHPRYKLVCSLGRGSFGFVVKAKDRVTNKMVAIKFIQRGRMLKRFVLREILNHRSLRHPHVVQFNEVFLTDSHLAIAMEYADRGDLFSYVRDRRRLDENSARWFFQQIIFTLDYCHKRGVTNRDIKLENILLQGATRLPLVKLCDFGYSKHEEWDSAAKSYAGTPDYMAPEVVSSHGSSYDAKMSDLWSCAVVLYVMLVGRYPFSRASDNRLQNDEATSKVLTRVMTLDYEIPDHVSDGAKDLLSRLLTKSPQRRATIEEVMRHPWYSEGLPKEALQLNDVYLRTSPDDALQSTGECKRIVEEAMMTYDVLRNSVSVSDAEDDFIDQAIEEENEN